jgi:predicted metalloprotease with PDZ domain
MKKVLLALVMALPLLSMAQKTGAHAYKINLNTVVNDRVKVEVDARQMHFDADVREVMYHFPATIPGTYATLDYGRFIKDFKAFDRDGKALKVRKKGNTFTIMGSPALLEYWVDDTFDSKVRRNKVFEPAGTNNQEGKNFLLNAAGYFGYFDGSEELPIQLEVVKSPTLYGLSALRSYTYGNTQNFSARSYHQFLDSPIMFSKPDTTSFRLANAKVVVGVFSESGRELSQDIYDQVHTSMEAIANFLGGTFPVDNYAFIFYIKDYSEFLDLVEGRSRKPGEIFRALRALMGQGFGALEHGNSSVYFLPDFGNDMVLDEMADVCIHEFFHILTPLNLHSEEIGQFNYIEPKMSKHLWLYEGITEYFAGISQVKGGVITPEDYLRDVLRGKIRSANKYPTEKMSFTEMSENVLHNPHKKQYGQVYQRGALMGALLDIRIMELTGGEKTLRDVVVELSQKYGWDQSFQDDAFIAEFVEQVHPDLQDFFDRYVEGREPLPVSEYLAKVGVLYDESYVGPMPMDPLRDFDVKRKAINVGGKSTVKKVGENNPVGFETGDRVGPYKLSSIDGFVPEGTMVSIPIERGEAELELPYVVQYKQGATAYFIRFAEAANASHQALQNIWFFDHPAGRKK